MADIALVFAVVLVALRIGLAGVAVPRATEALLDSPPWPVEAAEQGPAVTVIAAAVFGVLALVVVALLPDAFKHATHGGVVAGSALGALLMLAVGAALEV